MIVHFDSLVGVHGLVSERMSDYVVYVYVYVLCMLIMLSDGTFC